MTAFLQKIKSRGAALAASLLICYFRLATAAARISFYYATVVGAAAGIADEVNNKSDYDKHPDVIFVENFAKAIHDISSLIFLTEPF